MKDTDQFFDVSLDLGRKISKYAYKRCIELAKDSPEKFSEDELIRIMLCAQIISLALLYCSSGGDEDGTEAFMDTVKNDFYMFSKTLPRSNGRQ